jgi:hypothetical protein
VGRDLFYTGACEICTGSELQRLDRVRFIPDDGEQQRHHFGCGSRHRLLRVRHEWGCRVARLSCYTGVVEKAQPNVTLVVEEDLLLAARKVALDQRTSVNQLVREFLAALVEDPGRRRLARVRLRKAFETGLVEVGDRKWSRDDLYDR